MTAQEILTVLKEQFGEAILESRLDVLQPWIKIAPAKLKKVGFFLRDTASMQFDFLMSLSGIDYNNGKLGVVYHLSSIPFKHKIVLKAECTKDDPHVQTVSEVWATANWHEREAFDLFGIVFDEHPDLRRILLPYDWEGYPLRKDYKTPEFYNGMKVPY
ncbi:MAG: NADH-quinone oxidoreductase subunit C [bacterium]